MCKKKKENHILGNIINIVSPLFCIACTAIIFIIICKNYPRHQELDFDYMGIIIGALSILVTVLIGWNIYTIIDTKEIRKNIGGELNYAHNKMDENLAFVYARTAQIMALNLTNVDKKSIVSQTIHSALISIKMYSNLGSFKECNSVANTLDETLKYIKKEVKFDINERTEFLIEISKIKNQEQINALNDIKNYFSEFMKNQSKG